MSECAICMDDYDEQSYVTSLPCNEGHYFHTHCITDWITKGQNTCPLCRTEITAAQLDNLRQEMSLN